MMICGDNNQCPYSKVQRKNTKQEQSKNNPLKELEVGSEAIAEWASTADRSHAVCSLS